jgi:hypothetical protein
MTKTIDWQEKVSPLWKENEPHVFSFWEAQVLWTNACNFQKARTRLAVHLCPYHMLFLRIYILDVDGPFGRIEEDRCPTPGDSRDSGRISAKAWSKQASHQRDRGSTCHSSPTLLIKQRSLSISPPSIPRLRICTAVPLNL